MRVDPSEPQSQDPFEYLEYAPLAYQSLDGEGRILQVNQAWLNTLGYDRPEVIGRHFGEFMSPCYREATGGGLAYFRTANEVNNTDLELVRKDGRILKVLFDGRVRRDQHGRVERYYGLFRDVTEPFPPPGKFSQPRGFRHTILERKTEFIFRWRPDTTITFVNAECCEFFGHKSEDFLGRRWLELAPPEMLPMLQVYLADALRERRVLRFDHELVDAQGNRAWVQWTSTPILDADQQLVEFQSTGLDVTRRKEAEEAMLAQRDFAQSIVRNAQALMIVLDTQGKIVLFNPFALELMGANEKDVIGKHFGELLVSEEHRKFVRAGMDSATFDHFPQGHEDTRKNFQGREVTVRWFASQLRDSRGKTIGTLIVGHDITERKRVELALKESEARYRNLFENSPLPLITEDLREMVKFLAELARKGVTDWRAYFQANPQEGARALGLAKLLDVNLAAVELSEAKDRNDIVEHLWDIIGANGESCLAILGALARGEKNHRSLMDIRTLHGGLRRILLQYFAGGDEEDPFSHVLFSLVDITEREKARQEIEQQKNFAENLIETAPSTVLVMDVEGRILRMNRYGLRLIGYAQEEVIGKSVYDGFLYESDHPRVRDALAELLEKQTLTDREIPVRSRSGEPVLINWSGSVLRDSQGKVTGLLATGHDVTELRRKEEQLRQAQKMEAIGLLAGGIAHDFNNQLTVIKGYCDLLRRGQLGNLSIDDALAEIQSAAQRSTTMISQLLAFSRKQALRPAPLHLGQFLQSMSKSLLRLLDEKVQLQIICDEPVGWVHADPTQVEQGVLNLATNAIDAMPKGGTLTLEVRNFIEPGQPPQVMLVVNDTGEGIAEENLCRIFDPFYTTKPVGKGTGLGLAMVYGFVKQSGGQITVSSSPGRGTTFRIYLPMAIDPPPQVC